MATLGSVSTKVKGIIMIALIPVITDLRFGFDSYMKSIWFSGTVLMKCFK